MKKALPFLLLLVSLDIAAQQPEQILDQWASGNPIEKIYFHFDRSEYIAGQTIWFKSYVYSNFLPADKSTDLFVELSNMSSVIIQRQALPLVGGFSRGQIEMPDTMPGGNYVLRAYTATMLNHDPGFIYQKNFTIIGKNQKVELAKVRVPGEVTLEFFPERGNFITGLSNTNAFKATNENALPVKVSGTTRADKGGDLITFSSYHDGMGNFDITP